MNATGTPSHSASAAPRSTVTPRGRPAASCVTKNADIDGAATTPTRNLPLDANSFIASPMLQLCPAGCRRESQGPGSIRWSFPR